MRRLSALCCLLLLACGTSGDGSISSNPSQTVAADPTHGGSTGSTTGTPDDNGPDPSGPDTPEPSAPTGPSGPSLPPAPDVPGTIALSHLALLPGPKTTITDVLNGATTSIHAGLYLLTDYTLINALKNAQGRGVTVQIVIDDSSLTHQANTNAVTQLTAKGVGVVKAAGYSSHHCKYAVVDGTKAVVSTSNWSAGSFTGNREAITIVEDSEAVRELDDVFKYDYSGTALPYETTRWVLSPNNRGAPQNSRERIEGLVQAATSSLFVVVQDIDDNSLADELSAAVLRGVSVRLLMADPAARDGKYGSALVLKNHGVTVRYLSDPYLHEKLLVSDDTAYIGSHNFTWSAFEKNREVGMLVVGAARDTLLEQAEADWSVATTW